MKERIIMRKKDVYRLEILTNIQKKRLKQVEAAQLLKISTRQVRRLLRQMAAYGPQGIVSKKLGAPSNRKLPEKTIHQILNFFQDPNHYDFGPTLAHEYLLEKGIKASLSSV
jgi:hypothetical protein